MIAILAIVIFGGPVLQGMSIAMIWGIFIGTYSSIFVAAAIVLVMGTDINRKPVEDTPGFQGVS
jgi:preprotein translocase subunit SecF/SecD/SecF fusion protein